MAPVELLPSKPPRIANGTCAAEALLAWLVPWRKATERFRAHHAGELRFRAGSFNHTAVDVDISAGQRKRIDRPVVHDLELIRNIFRQELWPRACGPGC